MDNFKTAGFGTDFSLLFFSERFSKNFYPANYRFHPTVSLGSLEFPHVFFIGVTHWLAGQMGSLRSMRSMNPSGAVTSPGYGPRRVHTSHTPQTPHLPGQPVSDPNKKDMRKLQRSQRDRWMKPVVRRVKVLRETFHKEQQRETGMETGGLKIVHFGGLGEVGRNMSAVQYDDEIILIDAGVRFGDEKMPGIDFIIPNPGYLEGREHMVKAMFFTHGHMDHVGALPFVLDKIGDPDFYAAPLTRAILMKRLDEFKDRKPIDIMTINPGDEIKISDKISVKVLRINHSIPDDLEIIIKTPIGNVVHTSDFKFDDTPVNDKPADIEEMERMSREEGVLLLMSD